MRSFSKSLYSIVIVVCTSWALLVLVDNAAQAVCKAGVTCEQGCVDSTPPICDSGIGGTGCAPIEVCNTCGCSVPAGVSGCSCH
jgi:hypothetical protein